MGGWVYRKGEVALSRISRKLQEGWEATGREGEEEEEGRLHWRFLSPEVKAAAAAAVGSSWLQWFLGELGQIKLDDLTFSSVSFVVASVFSPTTEGESGRINELTYVEIRFK